MDVALAKKVSVDLVKVRLMQIPDIQQLVEEIWKSTGVMDSEKTLCDHHAEKVNLKVRQWHYILGLLSDS